MNGAGGSTWCFPSPPFTGSRITSQPSSKRTRYGLVLRYDVVAGVDTQTTTHAQVLKKGGLLAFTMVLSGPSEFLSVLDIVSALSPWRDHLQHYSPPGYPLNPEWVNGRVHSASSSIRWTLD
jgi:hypothetical protein